MWSEEPQLIKESKCQRNLMFHVAAEPSPVPEPRGRKNPSFRRTQKNIMYRKNPMYQKNSMDQNYLTVCTMNRNRKFQKNLMGHKAIVNQGHWPPKPDDRSIFYHLIHIAAMSDLK
jgi:hypothetical protein